MIQDRLSCRKTEICLLSKEAFTYAKSDWSARAWGFKKAADILTNHFQKTLYGGDLVIYPIVYLCRHHLELSWKDIIIRGNNLLDKLIPLEFDHSLNKP